MASATTATTWVVVYDNLSIQDFNSALMKSAIILKIH